MIRAHKAIPEVVSGYELDRLQFSVIVPIERTNLITNPSFETNTTGYTSVDGATLTRTTTTQRRGVYSLQIKPGLSSVSGVYYTSSALTAGQTYAFSLDVFIRGGKKFQIRAFDGVRSLVTRPIIGKNYWERVSFIFTAVTTGAHRFYFEKNGESNNTFTDNVFTDGWQLELCEAGNYFETTYIDGDQQGLIPNQFPPAYFWDGFPHASISIRSGQTRAGGRVIHLSDFGFDLTSIAGLDSAPVKNASLPFALIGGSTYQRSTYQSRQFTLIANIGGETLSEFEDNIQFLIDSFKFDIIGLGQPLKLLYQELDDNCRPSGEMLEIICSYNSGLEGDFSSYYNRRVAISFLMYDPFINSVGNSGSQIAFARSISGVSYLFKIDRNGTPTGQIVPTTTVGGQIIGVIVGADGYVYAFGDFTMIGSVFANRIARFNGNSWEALGSGANNQVGGVTVGLNGYVYAFGSFTAIGGIAANGVAYWNGSSWNAMGSGPAGGSIVAMITGLDGRVYAGGSFTSISGVANTVRIAFWTGTVWNAMGTGGASGQVSSLGVGLDGSIYAGGSFTAMGGVATTQSLAKWTGSAWVSIGQTNAGVDITAIAIGIDGTVYIGGNFSSIGGLSISNIAQWNGVQWSALGSGISITISRMFTDNAGNLYVTGGTGTPLAGGLTILNKAIMWNGTDWMLFPFKIFTTVIDFASRIVPDNRGNFYIIGASNATFTVHGTTTITNNGKSSVYPIFKITGSGIVQEIINRTTGKRIQFSLTLIDNEEATLNLRPGFLSFVSNYRGNIISTILPGSDLSEFVLQPGDNIISLYIDTAGTNAKGLIQWNNSQPGILSGNRAV